MAKYTGRYYIFGTYDTKAEALRAAKVLRKRGNRAHVKKGRGKTWVTMYG